jgi:hypothetical protein
VNETFGDDWTAIEKREAKVPKGSALVLVRAGILLNYGMTESRARTFQFTAD